MVEITGIEGHPESNEAGAGKVAARTLIVATVLVATVWDVYWIRVGWPVVGAGGSTAAVCAALLASREPTAARLAQGILAAAGLTIVVLVSALWGSTQHEIQAKAPAGMLLGIGLMAVVLVSGVHKELQRALTAVLVAHVGFWVVQCLVCRATRTYLDFTGWLSNNEARYEAYAYAFGYQGPIVRGTGLFAEPAAYSTFIYMAIAARMSTSGFRLRALDWAAIATMLGSFSMSGVILALLLVIVASTSASTPGRALGYGAGTAALGGTVLYGFASTYVVGRLSGIDHDNSAVARFGGVSVVESADWATFLFGRGAGTYYHGAGRGSGIVDSLLYFGVVGTGVWLVIFGGLFIACGGPWWRKALLWSATLGAAPLQTNPFWWVWTACMVAAAAGEQYASTRSCNAITTISPCAPTVSGF
jgi:hypothetical protein